MGIQIEACPVVTYTGNCPHCGGGWPGTKSSSEVLTKAARAGILIPEKLGCGTLQRRAEIAIREMNDERDALQQEAPFPLSTDQGGSTSADKALYPFSTDQTSTKKG